MSVSVPENSRVKLYRPSISIVELLMSHYHRSHTYAESVRENLRHLLGLIDTNDRYRSGLRERLLGLEYVYGILEQFTWEILILVKESASRAQLPV